MGSKHPSDAAVGVQVNNLLLLLALESQGWMGERFDVKKMRLCSLWGEAKS